MTDVVDPITPPSDVALVLADLAVTPPAVDRARGSPRGGQGRRRSGREQPAQGRAERPPVHAICRLASARPLLRRLRAHRLHGVPSSSATRPALSRARSPSGPTVWRFPRQKPAAGPTSRSGRRSRCFNSDRWRKPARPRSACGTCCQLRAGPGWLQRYAGRGIIDDRDRALCRARPHVARRENLGAPIPPPAGSLPMTTGGTSSRSASGPAGRNPTSAPTSRPRTASWTRGAI